MREETLGPSHPLAPHPRVGPVRLTLIAQGHARSCPAAVSAELHKEVSARAEQALNGQVLHLIGIVDRRGLQVVPISDDEPGSVEWQLHGWLLTRVGCGPVLVYCPSSRVLPSQALPSHQDIPSPVVIFCQGNLFKVQMQSLALRGLKQPVAGEVVAVVAREARRDNAAGGGIADHSTAGSWEKGRTVG